MFEPEKFLYRVRRYSLLLISGVIFGGAVSSSNALADEPAISFHVDADSDLGSLPKIWNWFGYDEPNYTYMRDGKQLITELANLDDSPIYIRTHNLLTSGDGSADRKWGSTNAYTEDADGNPVYDWTLVDKIVDTFVANNVKPVMEMGFMPEALSAGPAPYKHSWASGGELWTAWAWPPKDYTKWNALIYQWVTHSLERYGHKEVESWLWQPWNEPNIGYWQGSYEEFVKLYDYSAEALKRACPNCKIGGPHTTNPDSEKAAAFLRDFLAHCESGKNYATGKTGAPLDYIAFHAKGNPQLIGKHIRMDMSPQLKAVAKGFEVVKSFEKYSDTPVLIGEFDPEGCAACSIQKHPQYAYRNGTMYPTYTAASQVRVIELVEKYEVNFLGALTWGFEFEKQRYFDGFRDLATNGIHKPVFNVFKMFSLMPTDTRLQVNSDKANSAADIIAYSVRGAEADVGALASRNNDTVSVLIWNYHDDDVPAQPSEVSLYIDNIPTAFKGVHYYRIDKAHSNAYEVWKSMGSPQSPTKKQYKKLVKAAELVELNSGDYKLIRKGKKIEVTSSLPRQSVSLIVFENQGLFSGIRFD